MAGHEHRPRPAPDSPVEPARPVRPGEATPDPGPGEAAAHSELGPGDAAGAGSSPAADAELRLARRRFFRAFADDAMNAAATIVGMAGALRQTTAEAAGALLSGAAVGAEADPGPATAPPGGPGGPAAGIAAAGGTAVPPVSPGFRSPFRLDGGRLLLVDQRRLPGEIAEVECVSGADVAQAMRDGVVRGAPALGQVAALGLALTAGRAATSRPWARRAIIAGTANALRNARPAVAHVRSSLERMLARQAAIGELDPDGEAIAAALREEAEAIVGEATLDHARLARLGAELLPWSVDRPTEILTLGSTGPLSAGPVGTALGVVVTAVAEGRSVHVHVAETRPGLEGSRLVAWELLGAEIPCTLIVDAAVGWLLASGEIDAVLVGADWIAANGDVANAVGTYPLAAVAARHGIPVHVVAPTASIGAGAADGAAIPLEMRVASEVLFVAGNRSAPPGAAALSPAFDVTPAALVATIVTEEGVLRPPFEPAIAAALAAAKGRRTGLRGASAEAPSEAAESALPGLPAERPPDEPSSAIDG